MKKNAPRNRTISLNPEEETVLNKKIKHLTSKALVRHIENTTIQADLFEVLDFLPEAFVDLMFVDPPYNMRKTFNKSSFNEMDAANYEKWLDSWVSKTKRLLKPKASIYICGDWRSSPSIYNVASKYFKIQNRITWEREKGRGAKANWKNCSEDIWFCTMADEYYFDLEAVKVKRKVLAPYKDDAGKPKDWEGTAEQKYRLTHPSNLWTNLTVPFWSMPENTEHPTQKPEKLLAKVILASSKPKDLVFDPFLGSGTTSVVAKKLGRRYVGIELDEKYCLLAEKRLALAEENQNIQGFVDGIFWERNSGP
ncbi:MAG: DNA methyltransferase [Pseudomonadota bacterium]